MSISGTIDSRELLKKLKRFEKEMTGAAMSKAENRALTTMRKVAKGEMEGGLGVKLKKKVLDIRIRVNKARKGRGGALIIRTDKMALGAFEPNPKKVKSARGPRTGVTIKTKSGRKLVKGFLIPGRNQVFTRTSKDRAPIVVRYTRLPGRLFAQADVVARIRREGLATLGKNIQHEYQHRVNKIFGGV